MFKQAQVTDELIITKIVAGIEVKNTAKWRHKQVGFNLDTSVNRRDTQSRVT